MNDSVKLPASPTIDARPIAVSDAFDGLKSLENDLRDVVRPQPADRTVALVHDWCPDFRGGERVLAELCRLFPGGDVFTLFDFLDAEVKREHFDGVRFQTSVADRLPAIRRYYRALFWACPFLMEQFDVTGYDAVVSSSAAFARGVITRPDQPHVCYVHSPIRYAWDEQFSYLEQARLRYGPKGLLYRYLLHRLRTWDAGTAHSPDVMLANSSYVAARIRRIYGREARVAHPPVPLGELPFTTDKDDYYVTASFLAPYKRTDLVIAAFNEMPTRRLVVVGGGQQASALRASAGPNITFTGFMKRAEYTRTVANARAFVFAGCEDFGIAMAEAQGCGTPVIAFGRGGARDIVRDLDHAAPTGLLFSKQTTAAVVAAVDRFVTEADRISADACLQNAGRFSVAQFRRHVVDALDEATDQHARH
jgi:glycosyltransferase involved in cell wall biosynthesis